VELVLNTALVAAMSLILTITTAQPCPPISHQLTSKQAHTAPAPAHYSPRWDPPGVQITSSTPRDLHTNELVTCAKPNRPLSLST
jgi:hypothetical protein